MPANFSFSLGNARIHTNLSLPPWCSLSTYYAPRTALRVRETSVHKTDTNLSLCGKYILVARASWLSPGSWPLCPVALTFLQFSAFNLRPVRNQEFSLTFQIKLYSCQPSVSLMTNIELNDKRKIELAEKGRDCGMSTLWCKACLDIFSSKRYYPQDRLGRRNKQSRKTCWKYKGRPSNQFPMPCFCPPGSLDSSRNVWESQTSFGCEQMLWMLHLT